jgi:hypothetical protein
LNGLSLLKRGIEIDPPSPLRLPGHLPFLDGLLEPLLELAGEESESLGDLGDLPVSGCVSELLQE